MALKTIFRVSVFLVMISLLVTLPALALEEMDERLRVGVLEFGGSVSREYREAAVSNLTSSLYDLGRFDLVDRSRIEEILEEQRFQQTGIVDRSQAVEIGHILALDIAVTGNINRLTTEYERTDEGAYYQASADVTVQFIDVETGEILHIIEQSASASNSNAVEARHRALSRTFGSSFQRELRGRYSLFANIIRVEDGHVFFMSGSELGVVSGSRYHVLRELEMGRDLSDDLFTEEIGVVEVTDVSSNMSRARIVWSTENIQEGDIVREMPSRSVGSIKFNLTYPSFTINNEKSVSAPHFVFQFGSELPFSRESGITLGYTGPKDLSLLNIGYRTGRELSLVPGRLTTAIGGEAGLSFAAQSVLGGNHQGDNAVSLGFYGQAFLGLKLYLSPRSGPRIKGGIFGQYGPTHRSWLVDEHSVSDQNLEYDEVRRRGYGLFLTLSYPLGGN